MNGKVAAGESTSERDSWGNVFWFLAIAGTMIMLSYEYVWSRFAFHNLVSFGGWFWTGLAVTSPWTFCLICVRELRKAVRERRMGRDVCMEVSVWIELAMLAAYLFLAPAVHRFPSLAP